MEREPQSSGVQAKWSISVVACSAWSTLIFGTFLLITILPYAFGWVLRWFPWIRVVQGTLEAMFYRKYIF